MQYAKVYETCTKCQYKDLSAFMAYMPTLGEIHCVECATYYNEDVGLQFDQSVVDRKRERRDTYHLTRIQSEVKK